MALRGRRDLQEQAEGGGRQRPGPGGAKTRVAGRSAAKIQPRLRFNHILELSILKRSSLGQTAKPSRFLLHLRLWKIKDKYLSKDVTTLNFNDNLSANFWWEGSRAAGAFVYFEFPKEEFGNQHFFLYQFSVMLSVGLLVPFASANKYTTRISAYWESY